jgi:hypothetical protein
MNFKLKNIKHSIYSIFFFVTIVSGFIFIVSFSLKKTKKKQDKVAKVSVNGIPEVKDGDIIFQSSKSQQSKAVEVATSSKYSHCGIVFIENNVPYVYEAVQPVGKRKMTDWIISGVNQTYIVKRFKGIDTLSSKSLLEMKNYATAQFGKNYDAYFAWSDKEMYCSELVYKIYMNCINFELATPKSLRDFNIDAPVVRKIMRERYGENIPYDELMISPGQLFDSPSLITVYTNEK